MATYHLTIPISDDEIKQLHVGDQVFLTGVMVTGRDAAHSYIIDNFVETRGQPPASEAALYAELKNLLKGSTIYHCGPVVRQDESGKWHFVAAGPTTSSRMDVYTPRLIAAGLKAMIGKGDRSPKVREAIKEFKAVYFVAIGGAAALLAKSIKQAETIAYEDLGTEAIFDSAWRTSRPSWLMTSMVETCLSRVKPNTIGRDRKDGLYIL